MNLTSDWHCSACDKPSSYQGHMMFDDETGEFFMSCQDEERRKRVTQRWLEAWR